MALGGGNWVAQNKVLPGTYANFVSTERAFSVDTERGIVTVPYVGEWGATGEVVSLTAEEFSRHSPSILGYAWDAPEMREFREIYRHSRLVHFYRLNSGGVKATAPLATAKYVGERGNDLAYVISANVDDPTAFDVVTLLDNIAIDRQVVPFGETPADNGLLVWDENATLIVTPTAGTPLTGGSSVPVTNGDHLNYLDAIESYHFHAMACPSDNPTLISTYAEYNRRMRNERGIKFELVCYNPTDNSDFEGVRDVLNTVTDGGTYSLVYWMAGIVAGTTVNASAMNTIYDGEYTVNANFTQTQLEQAKLGGKLALHRVGSDYRILADINSLQTVTAEKNEDFKQGQTIRVIDHVAYADASIFANKYIGNIPNDQDGRVSLWVDLVKIREDLQTLRAIQNFESSDVEIEPGETPRSVFVRSAIQPTHAMEQLYMVNYIN